VTIGRTHTDGTVRLAREIPYGSPAWKERYNRRNSAESRNSVLERLGLKRMPVHRLTACHVTVLQGDFVANQRTLVRLIREATALRHAPPS
jgi:DNA-directed RNA polymerase subunit N (RpoN/RPB10)